MHTAGKGVQCNSGGGSSDSSSSNSGSSSPTDADYLLLHFIPCSTTNASSGKGTKCDNLSPAQNLVGHRWYLQNERTNLGWVARAVLKPSEQDQACFLCLEHWTWLARLRP